MALINLPSQTVWWGTRRTKGVRFLLRAGVFPSSPAACHCDAVSFLVMDGVRLCSLCSRIRALPRVPRDEVWGKKVQRGNSWHPMKPRLLYDNVIWAVFDNAAEKKVQEKLESSPTAALLSKLKAVSCLCENKVSRFLVVFTEYQTFQCTFPFVAYVTVWYYCRTLNINVACDCQD